MARPRAFFTAAALLALLLGSTGSASAHDALVGTTPVQDSTVESAPLSVTLEFSDAPQALGTRVAVTGPGGSPISRGAVAIQDTTASQPLDDDLPAGDYTVDWRATSADGHPLSGSFGFTVFRGEAADPPAATGSGDGAATAAAPPSDTSSSPVVWIAVAGIAAGASFLVARQLRRSA